MRGNAKFNLVSKEEFDKFIENYPNELYKDVNQIFEPTKVMYHDFTTDEGYHAIVAYISMDTEYNEPEDSYYISEYPKPNTQ